MFRKLRALLFDRKLYMKRSYTFPLLLYNYEKTNYIPHNLQVSWFVRSNNVKLDYFKVEIGVNDCNKTTITCFMSLVSHKKSYLVCVKLTNFWIFTQPIPIFFQPTEGRDSCLKLNKYYVICIHKFNNSAHTK